MPVVDAAMHRSRILARLSLIGFLAGVSTTASAQDVVWTDQVHVTVAGTTLQKTSGCDGCADAGARSQQEIAAGDGHIEFTIGEANTFWFAGLSHGNTDTSYQDIDFSFRFNGAGSADVMENGIYRGGDTAYAAGDVFRIALVAGRVEYRRNGALLYTSQIAPTYPLLLDTALGSIGSTILSAQVVGAGGPPPPPPPPPGGGGGFVEKAGSPQLRPRFTTSQIASFLPPGGAKGAFTFPAPYNTGGVRLTNADDCAGAQDCLAYVGYSYWRNINNHAGSDTMYVFLGLDRGLGGTGPTLFSYNKITEQVQNLGPLFDTNSAYGWSSAESWYFSATQATKLYAYLIGGTQLQRYDVIARQFDATPAMDLDQCPRGSVCPTDTAYIIQPHSSDDDHVHSATVQNSNWQRLGCVVYRDNAQPPFLYYAPPIGYELDECHVDKSGRWLLLLEVGPPPNYSGDNRVVDLQTGQITTLTDAQGGLGHLDMGFGYAVGADNYNPQPNATILVTFPVGSTERPIGPVVHYNKNPHNNWDIVAANHIAHGNAKPGVPASSQYACGSNASRVNDMADEIVCFPLNPNRNPDGSLDVLVVTQVMTDLDAPGGGGGDDYAQMPKGNLDVTGGYFIWTTNMGGNRLDAFIVKVPAGLLMGGQ